MTAFRLIVCNLLFHEKNANFHRVGVLSMHSIFSAELCVKSPLSDFSRSRGRTEGGAGVSAHCELQSPNDQTSVAVARPLRGLSHIRDRAASELTERLGTHRPPPTQTPPNSARRPRTQTHTHKQDSSAAQCIRLLKYVFFIVSAQKIHVYIRKQAIV